MKKTTFFIAPLFALISCTTTPEATTENVIEEIPQELAPEMIEPPTDILSTAGVSRDIQAEEFKTGMAGENVQLIDVRTPEEFRAGSIEGAVNIDFLADDFETKIESLAKDQPVYLFCKSGGRSGQAKLILTDHGFSEVNNLIGGYSHWPY